VLGDDLAGVVEIDLAIDGLLAAGFLDAHHRLGVHHADLAGDAHLDAADALLLDFVEHRGHHFAGAGGDAAGAHADHHAVFLAAFAQRDLFLRLFLELFQLFQVHKCTHPFLASSRESKTNFSPSER
jgi:hypothetical protein